MKNVSPQLMNQTEMYNNNSFDTISLPLSDGLPGCKNSGSTLDPDRHESKLSKVKKRGVDPREIRKYLRR
jgi:hypothetical protein